MLARLRQDISPNTFPDLHTTTESSCEREIKNETMKKPIVMLAVLVAASRAHATLIDVTPGGFSLLNRPPIFFTVVALPQLAGVNINGTQVVWSPFEPFGPNQFSITTDGINASISWDLTSTDGFLLQYVLLEGVGRIDNIYRAQTTTKGSKAMALLPLTG
jgi:hypothetical protein